MKSTIIALAALGSVALVAAVPSAVEKRGGSSCPSSQFFYSKQSCCLPTGGPSSYSQCPSDRSCPANWYWHDGYNVCVPKYNPGTSNSTPDCGSGGFSSWDDNDQCCKTPPPSTPTNPTPTCPSSHFFWATKACCLPNGGQTPGQCPNDRTCPSDRYWNDSFGCCVPTGPNSGTPSCDSQGPFKYWDDNDQCCKVPPPTPSQGVRKTKRNEYHPKSACPSDLRACPIAGTKEIECIDPEDLDTCGGCPTLGKGQNCNAIPNALSVTCLSKSKKCKVSSCEEGFTPYFNGISWRCASASAFKVQS